MSSHIYKCLFSIFLLSCNLFASLSVTVEQTDPGSNPQIHVNGEAVRPRMFWGSFSGGSVEIDNNWSDVFFDITPPIDANATLHFRFGNFPGEVWLKNIQITDIETGQSVFPDNSFVDQNAFNNSWNVYPPDERNTVGVIDFVDSCFHVTLTDPPAGETWPGFHIYSDYVSIPNSKTYRFSCKAKSLSTRTLNPAVYHVQNGWTYLGGPSSYFEDQIRMAKDVGVNFITFNVSNCWLAPEVGDSWLPLDIACQNIININPNALLIPRIGMDAPNWWLAENPDAYMIFEDGSKGTKVSISHRKYRTDATAHLEKLCRHLLEKFPDNLAGIHPSGQNTGEWFYEQSWGSKFSGYDIATLTAWQNYSQNTSDIPSANSRRPASERLLLNPTEDDDVIKFNHFLQDEMADFLIELSNAARIGLGSEKLVVFFYGYHYELAAVSNGPATSGHYALQKILNAPNIDVLSGPISYYNRGPGQSGSNMTSVESILRAGKLWLNEDDTRTYLSTNLEDHARYGGCSTQAETQGVLLRNLAQSALRGYGSWWMDHGAGTGGGWFADPELWDVIEWTDRIDKDMMAQNNFYQPKIALILGENSMLHIAGGSSLLGRNFIYESRDFLTKSGASFGQYTLSDDIQNNLESELKLYLSAWVLSDSERETLINNKKNGETRVWFYAPGYITQDGTDLEAMQELTGFEFHKTSVNSTMAFPTDNGKTFGLVSSWGYESKIEPLFTVSQDSCLVLARYSNGQVAVAVKESDKGKDVFVGIPKLTDEMLKALVNIAGIDPISNNNVLLWNSLNYTVLHGAKEGSVNLSFNTNTLSLEDGITGESLINGNQITLNFDLGETRILKHILNNSENDNNENFAINFQLKQNYPNPFNPITNINYSIPKTTSVQVIVYNISGQKIDTIVDCEHEAGNYNKFWDGSMFGAGIYILQMKADNYFSSRKMLLIK